MSNVDDIVAGIPMQSLADQLGVDQGTAESAVRQALPALLGGMQANAADPAGEASLAGALDQHSPDLVDRRSGSRSGGHCRRREDRRARLRRQHQSGRPDPGRKPGRGRWGGDLIGKLLPVLAPIVLSYLAQRMQRRRGLGRRARSPEVAGSVICSAGSWAGPEGPVRAVRLDRSWTCWAACWAAAGADPVASSEVARWTHRRSDRVLWRRPESAVQSVKPPSPMSYAHARHRSP